VFINWDVRTGTVFFTAAAVAFLLPGSVSFSLWAFVILLQFQRMTMGTFTGDPSTPGEADQRAGATVAYAGIVLWIGRRHWREVLVQAFKGESAGTVRERYISYPVAFWCMIGFTALMIGWLVAAGASLFGAVVITLTLLLAFMVVARVVAETGLLHPASTLMPNKVFQLMAAGGWTDAVPLKTMFLSSHMTLLHHDARESFAVYASHGMKVADQSVFAGQQTQHDTGTERSLARRLLVLFVVVLAVGYVVSFSSMLWAEYRYAVQKRPEAMAVNDYLDRWAIQGQMMGPTLEYERGTYVTPHNPLGHVGFGVALTVGLSALRLTYTWWPLHPVGYLFAGTWPLGQLWFSIMLGWLARTLVLRFGGAKLYTDARPVIMGLIVGEATAGAFWLLLGVGLDAMGLEFRPVMFMPH
jgi:hypothetical protein